MDLPTFCTLVQLPYSHGMRISALVGWVTPNLDVTETHKQNSVVLKLNNLRFLEVIEFCCMWISIQFWKLTIKGKTSDLYCSIMTQKS